MMDIKVVQLPFSRNDDVHPDIQKPLNDLATLALNGYEQLASGVFARQFPVQSDDGTTTLTTDLVIVVFMGKRGAQIAVPADFLRKKN